MNSIGLVDAAAGEIGDCPAEVDECEDEMGDCLWRVSTPVAPAVVDPLDEESDAPKEADAGAQPEPDFGIASGEFWCETPCENAEEKHGHTDEPGVDVEHFANEGGKFREIIVPAQHGGQEEVEERYAEVADGGGLQTVGEKC